MNVNKTLIRAAALGFTAFACSAVFAITNLDAHGQSKVSNAMAKKWSQSDTGSQDGYKAQQDKSVINIGNKKSGNCVVNVGTVQNGQKAPKDIVVTTKEVINVCK